MIGALEMEMWRGVLTEMGGVCVRKLNFLEKW